MTATIGPSLGDVLISRPGPAETTRLTGIGVAASWSVRPPSTLSAEIITADLIKAFGTTRIKGRWIAWEHPTAGPWAGVITLTRPVKSSGTTELAARDFSFLLSHKRTAKAYDVVGAPAGAIAARVVADTTRAQYLWLNEISAEETGSPIGLSARGDDVLGVLNRLADESDQEWRVTPERDLEWQQRLGVDRSRDVVLVEDRHIIDFDFPDDLEAVVNDLLVTPADAAYARTNSLVVEDAASIQAVGTRMQRAMVIPDRISEATIRPVAEATLRVLARQGTALNLTTIDHEGSWGQFAAGDTVSVLLHSINEQLTVRVMVRTFDPRANTMSLAGDVL